MSARNAVVLLSGGLDSTTVLAIAQAEGFTPYALSFDYGQRHATELEAARPRRRARRASQHVVATIDLRVFGGSALTADIAVPKDRSRPTMGDGIPVTYVPARNTIFLSFALAWAEALGASDIFVGRQRPRLQRLPGLPARVHRGLRADGQPGHQGRRSRAPSGCTSTRR